VAASPLAGEGPASLPVDPPLPPLEDPTIGGAEIAEASGSSVEAGAPDFLRWQDVPGFVEEALIAECRRRGTLSMRQFKHLTMGLHSLTSNQTRFWHRFRRS
jgi:hypothetical protein